MFKKIVITLPEFFQDESVCCNSLFAEGLEILHLRKPDATAEELVHFIMKIEDRFRSRIVLHSHYHLAGELGLKGIHMKFKDIARMDEFGNCGDISVSCHSIEEIRQIPADAAYAFLSPVFPSISKPGYGTVPVAFTKKDLENAVIPVIALGGITPENIDTCMAMGFRGAAALGYIWKENANALNRFIRLVTPAVISIAGSDPSAGAGVHADLKTFEECGAYGYGIVSAVTFQSSGHFEGCRWISRSDLLQQISTLLTHEKRIPCAAKIGIIENSETLSAVIGCLKSFNKDIRIVWDPILQASAAPQAMHSCEFEEAAEMMADKVDIITPNFPECIRLFGSAETGILQSIARKHHVTIVLKGGHSSSGPYCKDRLFMPDGTVSDFPNMKSDNSKHGTGCFLSSALCSYLAKGFSIKESLLQAQYRIREFIDSNETLLGYRNIGPAPCILPAVSDVPLMYITDHKEGMTVAEQVEQVCRGGIKWVQLRMKSATPEELYRTGLKVKQICRRYNAIFTVDDNVDIARQLDADGVHLGKKDMDPLEARKLLGQGKIIGATCNTFEDVLQREKENVDYIGLGPFRFTTTKKNLSPILGEQGYKGICSRMKKNGIRFPVFAIGGITENDIPGLFSSGISGIALSGTVLKDDFPCKKAFLLEGLCEKEKFNTKYK